MQLEVVVVQPPLESGLLSSFFLTRGVLDDFLRRTLLQGLQEAIVTYLEVTWIHRNWSYLGS